MGVDTAERHQLDDCAKANIWDSSADHQTMSLAAVAGREGKLVSKRQSRGLISVQMHSPGLAGSRQLSAISPFSVFHRETERERENKKKNSLRFHYLS